MILARRPHGRIQRDHFQTVTVEITDIPADHIVLRVILIQVAPAARAVTTSTTAFAQTQVGDGILCTVLGEVITSCPGGPAVGAIVMSYARWEQYTVVPAAQLMPAVEGHPLVHNLGALGLNGLTAYFGMTRIAQPQPGQTVVVSAAGGGVGHIAGQIAHHAGARVIGTDETIRPAAQVWHGLDSAPDALVAVLAGESFGQAVVRLAEDPV